MQAVASDAASLPFRGGTDWFDGGKFIAVHQHLATPSNDLVGSSWNETTRNISRTVSAIEVLRPLAESGDVAARSEEHTSELQSRGHLVCRLLLEKKKEI